jgi:hypothetical protein
MVRIWIQNQKKTKLRNFKSQLKLSKSNETTMFLLKRGLLRKKHLNWIFKSDLIALGEELQYKLELTMEELRGPLYAALMQQSSALTLMYCVELIESQGSPSLKYAFS